MAGKVRAGNAKVKANRASSWLRGQAKHAANSLANELLHETKKENNNLGARELRRIEAGIRKAPSAKELEYIKSRPSRGKRRKAARESSDKK